MVLYVQAVVYDGQWCFRQRVWCILESDQGSPGEITLASLVDPDVFDISEPTKISVDVKSRCAWWKIVQLAFDGWGISPLFVVGASIEALWKNRSAHRPMLLRPHLEPGLNARR
jgi:hypothetical protein